MHIEAIARWCWLTVALLLLSACQTTIEKLPPAASGRDYTLAPGDKIRLSLYGDDSFSGDYNISPSGKISVPLIGDLQASGQTISALRMSISNRLAEGYYQDPRLTAEIVSYRPFYIIGEVNKPGVYPYSVGLTLRKAVALAGGYTYRANTGKVAIQREDMEQPSRIRADQSVSIAPGDTIQILERYF